MEKHIKESKFMAYYLRHDQAARALMDEEGYINVAQVMDAAWHHGLSLDFDKINEIVATDNKGRYKLKCHPVSVTPVGGAIGIMFVRANQGHSTDVDVKLVEKIPPCELWHGTAAHNVYEIMTNGIKKMDRQHVHLSTKQEVATETGKRHGEPLAMCLDTLAMYRAGIKFYESDNGVWLVEHVPSKYIRDLVWIDK